MIFRGRFLLDFSGFFFCIFSALGFLEGLSGGLWTQKRVKTRGLLRLLKRLFKAHDGPLGLILVSLVNLFGMLCKSAGPIRVSKLASLEIHVEDNSF